MQNQRALAAIRAAARMVVLSKRLGRDGAAEEAENGNAIETVETLEVPLIRQPSISVHSEVHSEPRQKGCKGDVQALWGLVTSSYINVLLLTAPLGIMSARLGWPPVATFFLNFAALIPLALILGDVTEDLGLRFGDVIGGLINATFGNVVEMVLSVAALEKGLFTLVASSLVGSILSNLLLVLGCCFLFGGMKYKTQSFNAVANRACSSLLFLSAIGIIVPTAAKHMAHKGAMSDEWVLNVSRVTAVVLLLIYFCYLAFQLVTHKSMFNGEEVEGEEAEEPQLSITAAIAAMTTITAIVTVCSELLTASIESVTESTGLSQAFLGIIVLPIAGNACEHLTAVMVAMKNKMDLAIGVALGSSIQIAIFGFPFAVLVGWATGMPFSLDLDPFICLALTVAVIHANFVTSDSNSHWLMGVELIATYILIAVAFLYR